jgi:beta propeller repeat protein
MKNIGGGSMKINKKLYSVTLASVALILFLILVPYTASAASPTVTETRITTNPSNSLNPDVYGNTIVWQDDRNGNWDVYIHDLSAKTEIHTTNKSNQVFPQIYGKRVVWEDEHNGIHDIYLQDLATKKQTRITTSGKALYPKIYDNRIVWMDGRNGGSLNEYNYPVGNWDIYMYDLSTSKEYQITTNNSTQADPDIYKDKIVWRDERNMEDNPYLHVQIYMYNLSTSVESSVNYGDSCFVLSSPRIYGNTIVWMAEGVGDYYIYVYDLSTSTLNMIGSPYGNGYACQPAIYGNRIVWEEGGMDPVNTDIIMYDISTSTETKITTNGSRQSDPEIYGDRIVWRDSRNGNQNDITNYDIYMGTLSENKPTPVPPVANFAVSPVSGKAPLKVKFTSTSTGSPTSWKWSFGDGSYSTAKNPVHTYNKAGKYTVSLTVKNTAGSNTLKKSSYINVAAPLKAPISAFSAFPTSGKAPLKVQFTDKSANSPTSWKWSFGDGTYSTQKNPAHSYSKVGKYTVSLTVKNAKGSNIKTISNYITVKK